MAKRLKGLAIRTLTSRPLATMFAPMLRGYASIFVLHRFDDPASGLRGTHRPELLRACLEALRRQRAPVLSVDELVSRSLSGEAIAPGTVAFTIDDGFWDHGKIGAEIFLEYDIPVTIFLITGFQDGRLWPWDTRLDHAYETSRRRKLVLTLGTHELKQRLDGDPLERRQAMRDTREILRALPVNQLEEALKRVAVALEVDIPGQPPAKHRPIGWGNARALEQRGVKFGPHTVSHRIVARLDDMTAEAELLGAWQRLETELRQPVNIYAWPIGRKWDFGTRDIEIVRRSGFHAALSTEPRLAAIGKTPSSDDGLFRISRLGFPGTVEEFLKMSSWIERGRELFSV